MPGNILISYPTVYPFISCVLSLNFHGYTAFYPLVHPILSFILIQLFIHWIYRLNSCSCIHVYHLGFASRWRRRLLARRLSGTGSRRLCGRGWTSAAAGRDGRRRRTWACGPRSHFVDWRLLESGPSEKKSRSDLKRLLPDKLVGILNIPEGILKYAHPFREMPHR